MQPDYLGFVLTDIKINKELEKRHNSGYIEVACTCYCGNKFIARKSTVLNGITKSCGCHKRDVLAKVNTSHGLSRSKIYKKYKNYKNRGGCSWDTFEDFYKWFCDNGYTEETKFMRHNIYEAWSPDNIYVRK